MGPPHGDEINPQTFPILHDLPEMVVRMLRKHYYAGVKAAEIRFRYNAAEEDSLTGELGGRLTEPQPILIRAGEEVFHWSTAAYKIRGRGANAPENELGADGIFPVRGIGPAWAVRCPEGPAFSSEEKLEG